MRGIGFVCTRGRSPPLSMPPILGAIHAQTGVSTSTIATATMKPHATEPSSTRARRESHKDIAMRVIAQRQAGNEGQPPALAVALTSVSELLSSAQAFDERIATREAAVGIVGLGYAGLPLAMVFAEAGFAVTGHRRERGARARGPRAALVPGGRPGRALRPPRRPPQRRHGLPRWCASSTRSLSACPRRCRRRARPTSPTSCRRPSRWRPTCAPGQLVVLQSTTYPGTTEEIVLPILERRGRRGRRGLLPGLRARARGPGQQAVTRSATRPSSWPA